MTRQDFIIPRPSADDFGFDWGSDGVLQITKELLGFRANGKTPGFLTRYEHGMRLIQMLWPKGVELEREWTHFQTGEKAVIQNRDFIRCFKALCENKRVALTGSSSSGKTFAASVYAVLAFMADPENTMIMISTTAGSDAERRVWGEVRDLHRMLDEAYPVGTVIDYIKCITLDKGMELRGKRDVKDRDIRNGIMLIPIPRGAEGENALGKIIGSKQKTGSVIWIIDELPHMIDDILRPVSNLESNPFFQLIGIGNANRKTDPHGRMCEPAAGWSSVSADFEEWEGAAKTKVLFFHGERTANFHPAVDQSQEERAAYPFPYLSTPAYVRSTAEWNGRGNAELGRRTIDYARFAIGFWHGADVPDTIMSAEFVKEHGADGGPPPWGPEPKAAVAGFDCGFAAGGDSNELVFATVGTGTDGKKWLLMEPESVRVAATVDERSSYRAEVAKQVVQLCKERNVAPSMLSMDINADGGLMMQAIQKEWGTHEVAGLSSLEPADDSSRYYHRVTQYWFQMAEAISTGRLRGFSVVSRYARDLFERRYESVGRGVVRVEKKHDMRARIKRSPDSGDAATYMMMSAIRAGFQLADYGKEKPALTDEQRARLDSIMAGLDADPLPTEDQEYEGSMIAGDDEA